MKIKLLIVLLLASINSFASDLDSLISIGNGYYQNNEYENAVLTYEKIISSGYESANLYYNIGNAYYKSNNLTKAILNYERALLLSPNDEDINYNLDLAKTYVVDKINIIPKLLVKSWIQDISATFNSNVWAIISTSLFILFLILFSLYLFMSNITIKKNAFWLSFIVLLISIFSLVFSSQQKEKLTAHDYAIVFTPSVTIKGSPDESGTELFLIHEGTKVKVVDEIGDWKEIQLPDGNKGWIKSSDIEII